MTRHMLFYLVTPLQKPFNEPFNECKRGEQKSMQKLGLAEQ